MLGLMHSGRQLSHIFIVILCLILVGCANGHEIAPTDTDMPTVDNVPTTVIPTETSRPEITDVANTSSYPTLTKTPKLTVPPTVPSTTVPDRPLDPEDPWLLFTAYIDPLDKKFLYAVNEDGTGVTQFIPEYVSFYAVQPGWSLEEGVAVAYITQTNYETTSDLTLKLIKLPDGEVQTITPLLLDDGSEAAIMLGYELRTLAWSNGLAWSPDGRTLAFVGGLDGESVDVYAYDTITGQITRLTDGPLQAYNLRWSPDGHFVIHDAASTTICMNCPQAEAMFAARADGLGAIPLISAPENSYGVMQIHDWMTTQKLLVSNCYYNHEDEIFEAAAQVVNLETGETTPALNGSYRAVAYSTTGGTWLLQPADGDAGLVLYSNGREQEIALAGIFYIWWSETYDTFFAETLPGQLFAISHLGEVTEVPIPPVEDLSKPSARDVKVSPDGAWWAWGAHPRGDPPFLWIGGTMAEPTWIELPDDDTSFVGDFIWSLDGQRLYFADSRDGLWYADQPDFEPVHVFSDLVFVSDFTWVP